MLGMLGMLGMLTPGMSGNCCDDRFTTMKPTPAATIMNTTAIPMKIAHGMPPDDFRGGGCHGWP